MIKNRWTLEEDEQLKQLVFYSQLGYKQIAEIMDRTKSACWNRAWELGFKKIYNFKKHTVCENFWETPNLLNSYWAGFSAADACLQPYKNGNGGKFVLDISTKDFHHLETFKADIQFLGNIENRETDTCRMSKIRVSASKRWFDDLERNFSIIHRKTFRLAPPNNLSLNCQLAFIIGYIDGDGSIILHKKDKQPNDVRFSFVSASESILRWIKDVINRLFSHVFYIKSNSNRTTNIRKYSKYYRYKFGGYRALAVFDFLKDFPAPKLQRKWNNPNILQFLAKAKETHPNFFHLSPELQRLKDELSKEY